MNNVPLPVSHYERRRDPWVSVSCPYIYTPFLPFPLLSSRPRS